MLEEVLKMAIAYSDESPEVHAIEIRQQAARIIENLEVPDLILAAIFEIQLSCKEIERIVRGVD